MVVARGRKNQEGAATGGLEEERERDMIDEWRLVGGA